MRKKALADGGPRWSRSIPIRREPAPSGLTVPMTWHKWRESWRFTSKRSAAPRLLISAFSPTARSLVASARRWARRSRDRSQRLDGDFSRADSVSQPTWRRPPSIRGLGVRRPRVATAVVATQGAWYEESRRRRSRSKILRPTISASMGERKALRRYAPCAGRTGDRRGSPAIKTRPGSKSSADLSYEIALSSLAEIVRAASAGRGGGRHRRRFTRRTAPPARLLSTRPARIRGLPARRLHLPQMTLVSCAAAGAHAGGAIRVRHDVIVKGAHRAEHAGRLTTFAAWLSPRASRRAGERSRRGRRRDARERQVARRPEAAGLHRRPARDRALPSRATQSPLFDRSRCRRRKDRARNVLAAAVGTGADPPAVLRRARRATRSTNGTTRARCCSFHRRRARRGPPASLEERSFNRDYRLESASLLAITLGGPLLCCSRRDRSRRYASRPFSRGVSDFQVPIPRAVARSRPSTRPTS